MYSVTITLFELSFTSAYIEKSYHLTTTLLYIPEHPVSKEPITLDKHNSDRFVIYIGAHAQVTIEDSGNNKEIRVWVSQYAKFTWVGKANQVSTIFWYLGYQADCTIVLMHTESNLDHTFYLMLCGEYAHACFKSLYATREQISSVKTYQQHLSLNTSSTVEVKGIVCNQSQFDFKGTIRIEKDLVGVSAHQNNKSLVLSDYARATSVPILEILSNEVQCTHGSAIGQFDSIQLMYLSARGIEPSRALQILLKGFVYDILKSDTIDVSRYFSHRINQIITRIKWSQIRENLSDKKGLSLFQ